MQAACLAFRAKYWRDNQRLAVVIFVRGVTFRVRVPSGAVPKWAVGSDLAFELALFAFWATAIVFAWLGKDKVQLVLGFDVHQEGVEDRAGLGTDETFE